MIYCNITLPDILDKVSYSKFIDMYKDKFVKLISKSTASELNI